MSDVNSLGQPKLTSTVTEKSAEEWRQIYKSLQLLEFLIKNGSERVIDDARSHLSLLKMMRQFHYIDQNGKDQGINVRNRAKELAELLGDVERIRAERKKARATRNKYSGVEGGAGLGSGMSSGSRYGGFGSEDQGGARPGGGYGQYSGGVYGDGGGFGGQETDYQEDGSGGSKYGAEKFEEYDEGDDAPASSSRRPPESSRTTTSRRAAAKQPEPVKKKEPEIDLFSFDEPAVATTAATGSAPLAAADDDDFDDFQSAAPATSSSIQTSLAAPPASTTAIPSYTQFAAPQPVSAPQAANLSNMTAFSSLSPTTSTAATPANYSAFSPPVATQQPQKPVGFQGGQPNYFTSVPAPSSQPTSSTAASAAKPAAAKSSGDAFGSLWSTASVGVKKSAAPSQGPALGQLAKEKASAAIWGTAPSPNVMTHPTQQGASDATAKTGKEPKWMDDLLG